MLTPSEQDILVHAIEGGLLDDLVPLWRAGRDEVNLAARATREAFARFEQVLGRKIDGRNKWPEHEALAEAATERIITVGR